MDHLSGVRILWESGVHDGVPISGLANFAGRDGWFFAVFDELEDEWEYPRRLLLYELSDGELAYEWRRHRAWESTGITKYCHHDDIPQSVVESPSALAKFYDEYPPRRGEYEKSLVIGWFWAADRLPS